ncbi:MAG: DUF4242 domain-containing protein [Azospirillaceae bacterium]
MGPDRGQCSPFFDNRELSIDSEELLSAMTRQAFDGRPTIPKQEEAMSVYMVERELKGISMDNLAGAQRAAIAKAAEMTAGGTAISYIRTTFAPEDGRCMCLFEASTEAEVRRLNDEAGIPYSRVVPALDLTP